MQHNTPEHSQSPLERLRRSRGRLSCLLHLNTPGVGYIAAFVFVILLWLLEKLDSYVPQTPLFLGAPFGLVAILVALFWGTGPALLALVLSLLVLTLYVSPGILNADVLRDMLIIGPFVLLDIVVIAVVVRLEHARRLLLHTHHELETAHARMLHSHEQLEQANALKDYVLTRAAHELRTPLTTILGRTQLLTARVEKSGETPENWEAVEKYLPVVEARALHLRALIDSLFELSRIHSEPWPTPLPLCDLKSLCCDTIEEIHAESGRVLELDFPPEPLVLPAHDQSLSQALANILSNATKYSKEHTTITLHVTADDTYVTLRVHNEGPTLTPQELEHLFQPFYRTPAIEYSSIKGWGLGLTISKTIVERHQGQIWAASAPGQGLDIFVRLPLHPAQL